MGQVFNHYPAGNTNTKRTKTGMQGAETWNGMFLYSFGEMIYNLLVGVFLCRTGCAKHISLNKTYCWMPKDLFNENCGKYK